MADLGFTLERYFVEEVTVWGLEVSKDGNPVQLIEQKPRSAGGTDNFYYTFSPGQGRGALAGRHAPSGRFKTQREAMVGYLSVYYSLVLT